MALTDDDVREILRIIDSSPLDELRIETEGFSLHVRRGGAPLKQPPSPPAVRPATAPPELDAPASARPAAAPPEPATPAADGVVIAAPMLGTFYRAEGPGKEPFVEVGSRVEPDTTVAIVEVMKMMNSVPAGVSGVIEEVLAENAQLVEYGQPLFRVRGEP
jgi:acetyl-CoA carboxylase biotin carboxyl carrier protein